MGRIGKYLTNVITDSSTGESATFEEVSIYVDGTTMDDTKVDNFVYIKSSSLYYKRTGILNVRMLGADPTGATDSTAAFDRAVKLLSDSGVIYIPEGVYVGNFLLAHNKNISVVGNGSATVIQSAVANTPIIKINTPPNGIDGVRLYGGRIGNFTVKAHANGSTGPAIDAKGFNNTRFQDIYYKQNGSGPTAGNFAYGIQLSATSHNGVYYPCYNNEIIHFVLSEQSEFTGKAIFFTNLSQGTGANANNTFISRCYIYSNPKMTYGIDCLNSTSTIIDRNIFEVNVLATAVKLGNCTRVVDDNWFESVLKAFEFSTEGPTSPNNCYISNNYFSDPQDIFIPNDIQGNMFLWNKGAPITITGDPRNTIKGEAQLREMMVADAARAKMNMRVVTTNAPDEYYMEHSIEAVEVGHVKSVQTVKNIDLSPVKVQEIDHQTGDVTLGKAGWATLRDTGAGNGVFKINGITAFDIASEIRYRNSNGSSNKMILNTGIDAFILSFASIGFFGADPVVKQANPGTATGTDAAVINAISAALRAYGLLV